MSTTRRNAGFTLVELLVVVLIIGILFALLLPRYKKTVETSYADDAVSTVQIIGTTNRLYNLDNNTFTFGSSLNACGAPATCTSPPSSNPCDLINCKYMTLQNFSKAQYNFFPANGAVSSVDPCGLSSADNYVACAKRRVCGTDAPPCASATSNYAQWGYTMNVNGVIKQWPSTDGPPPPPS